MKTYIDSVLKEFEEIGFGNQAVIVGSKRVELIDFLTKKLQQSLDQQKTDIIKIIDVVREECRESEHEWDKGDECQLIKLRMGGK